MHDQSALLSVCDGVVLLAIRYSGGVLVLLAGELLLTKVVLGIRAAIREADNRHFVADTGGVCALLLLVLLPHDRGLL